MPFAKSAENDGVAPPLRRDGTKKCRKPLRLRHFGTPGGIRTHGLSLRSTKNRLIHAVLRCYAVFLNPLKYKVFRRISCFRVVSRFVPFFRLFWRPVSKMLAEPKRETNYSELRFESKLCLHVTNLTGKLYEKDNYTSIHYPSRGYVKKAVCISHFDNEGAYRFIFMRR